MVDEKKVDMLLVLGGFLLLAGLIGVQIAMRSENVRRSLNATIEMEGLPLRRQVPFVEETAATWMQYPPTPSAVIYLRLLNTPRDSAWVVLDGRPVKVLDKEGAAVAVANGVLMEVACADHVSVVVTYADSAVTAPPVGRVVSGNGLVYVGVVNVRSEQ